MHRTIPHLHESNESNKKFVIPVHEEVTFKDIAKYLDIQMQDNIKQQLEGIDEEVEKLGKVCDNLYKQSYEEYKNILEKEREDLDKNVKKYISNLKDNLIGLRNRINYDYKGKYREVSSKLNKLLEELKVTTNQSVKLQYKKEDLQEDCSFYEKQINDMKDMNIYLKYKLKLFLGDIQEEENNQEKTNNINNNNMQFENNENKKNSNKNNNLTNNRYNIQEDDNKIKNKVIKENVTEEISESEKYNKNKKAKNKEDQKNEEDKLYITATEDLYDPKKREFDEIEYLNSKLDLEEAQLMNYIQHEKEKNYKLSDIYNTLFSKTRNQYFNNLKDLIDEHKTINTSKSIDKNNMSESGSNNRSVFPSIYSTISNSGPVIQRKNMYTAEYPGPGYITRKENKEIILNFLENLEIKKLIYQLLYGE